LLAFALLAGCQREGTTPAGDAPSGTASSSESPAAAAEETPETAGQANAETATVYFTPDISPEGLYAVYEALGVKPSDSDKVGVKVTTGEPPSSNYLRQELIGDFVKGLNGTYLECNTAYGGQRASAAMHYRVAADHGFEPIVLMDDDAEIEIPIEGGLQLETDTVGVHIADFNFHIVLSHFKGHQIAGYGGALKMLSIGYGSFHGKNLIHTAGNNANQWFGGDQNEFLEAMADASKGVVNYVEGLDNGRIIFINVMNNLSIDCDCNGNPAEPDIHDIGILASTDPVALDQACLDLIYQAEGNESFVRRVEGQNGVHVIEAAEQIGLGSRTYDLIDINA
jgi:uncharacterized Fe-S center protein